MGFGSLFWGFLFMFDFRINGIDLLPDIIGYIFFYNGLSYLIERSHYFEKAKQYALPLIFLSIFTIYEIKLEQVDSMLFILFIGLGILISILNLMMVYHICQGIIELARAQENSHLADTAHFRWNMYLAMAIASILLPLILITIPVLAMLLVIPFVIISFIILILMMGLMKQAENQL